MIQIHSSDQTVSSALPELVQFWSIPHDKQNLLISCSYGGWSLMRAYTHPRDIQTGGQTFLQQGSPVQLQDLVQGTGITSRQAEIPARLGFPEAVNPGKSLFLPWGELLWSSNATTGYGCSSTHMGIWQSLPRYHTQGETFLPPKSW